MDVRIKVALIGLAGAVLVAIIGGLFGLYQYSKSSKGKTQSSVTHGSQSPIINVPGDFNGNININYGIPQSIIEEWEWNLKQNKITDENQDKKIQELANKYADLLNDLSKRSHEGKLSQKTYNKIFSGKFNEAEKILKTRFGIYENERDYPAAAVTANDLRILSELQLKNDDAKYWDQKYKDLNNLEDQSISHTDNEEKSSEVSDKNDISVKTRPSEQKSTDRQGEYPIVVPLSSHGQEDKLPLDELKESILEAISDARALSDTEPYFLIKKIELELQGTSSLKGGGGFSVPVFGVSVDLGVQGGYSSNNKLVAELLPPAGGVPKPKNLFVVGGEIAVGEKRINLSDLLSDLKKTFEREIENQPGFYVTSFVYEKTWTLQHNAESGIDFVIASGSIKISKEKQQKIKFTLCETLNFVDCEGE
jgi:hypothetical protein